MLGTTPERTAMPDQSPDVPVETSTFARVVFPAVLMGLSFLFLTMTIAAIATELRQLKQAEAEAKWRDSQCITP